MVSASFLTLVRTVGRPGVFVAFGSFSLMGALWISIELPETTNKSLEEIEALFERPEDNHSLLVDKSTGRLGSTDVGIRHRSSYDTATDSPLIHSPLMDSPVLSEEDEA